MFLKIKQMLKSISKQFKIVFIFFFCLFTSYISAHTHLNYDGAIKQADEPFICIEFENDSTQLPDSHYFFALSKQLQRMKSRFSTCWRDFAYLLDSAGVWLLGEETFVFFGLRQEEKERGVYRHKEISNKVRITFINGILTTYAQMRQNLLTLSNAHGNGSIHYIFRPTEGWTTDILDAIYMRTTFYIGFRSTYAYMLADMWRELIEEMGGVDGGGTIVHYAHSLGGTETDRARSLLTAQEQRMIRVYTIGSVTFVRNEGFQRVLNIISRYDGVSSIFLEPLGHYRNYFDEDSNLLYHEPCGETPYWPTDHLFNGDTYRNAIDELGRAVLREFVENDS